MDRNLSDTGAISLLPIEGGAQRRMRGKSCGNGAALPPHSDLLRKSDLSPKGRGNPSALLEVITAQQGITPSIAVSAHIFRA